MCFQSVPLIFLSSVCQQGLKRFKKKKDLSKNLFIFGIVNMVQISKL